VPEDQRSRGTPLGLQHQNESAPYRDSRSRRSTANSKRSAARSSPSAARREARVPDAGYEICALTGILPPHPLLPATAISCYAKRCNCGRSRSAARRHLVDEIASAIPETLKIVNCWLQA
jgi:hypothetical protein